MSAAPSAALGGRRRGISRLRLREAIDGYLCIAPWVLGFIIFTAFPIIVSFVLSFSRYTILDPPRFIGLENYGKMLSRDPLFWQSLKVTVIYTVTLVPLGTIGGYLLALLLNQAVKGVGFFRTVYYLPVVTPAIASSYLFAWILNPEIGLVNNFLASFNIQGPLWFASRQWVIPSFVIMSLWGLGGNMILYLAGLQGVPTVLYEAAMLDGAGTWAKFRHVTLPMTSPVIFFTFLTGMIGTLSGVHRRLRHYGGRPGRRLAVLHSLSLSERLELPQDGLRGWACLGSFRHHFCVDTNFSARFGTVCLLRGSGQVVSGLLFSVSNENPV